MLDTQQFKPMRRWRIAVVNALIAFLIVGHLYDIKTRTTHWPFGHYEMFAYLNESDAFARFEFVGVTADGREIPLTDVSYSAPMLVKHTEQALVKASLVKDPFKQHEAFKGLAADFLRRYELHLRNGTIVGPPLAGMRIDVRRWNHVDRWAGNVNTPDTIEVLYDSFKENHR